ncbi:MAG TPA: hypothetical protein VMV88_01645 [Gallionella sp.]|nr:hypothetical protein [Gallionella sp.]
MNRNTWLVAAINVVFLFGCASQHKAATIKLKREHTPSATKPVGRPVMSADGLIKGEIVGTPAPDSKFSRLQIGMTLKQVELLIGPPNRADSRITGKQYQPFYFGGDTRRTEAYYNGEGHLTFSNIQPDNSPDTLIRISVSPDMTGKH